MARYRFHHWTCDATTPTWFITTENKIWNKPRSSFKPFSTHSMSSLSGLVSLDPLATWCGCHVFLSTEHGLATMQETIGRFRVTMPTRNGSRTSHHCCWSGKKTMPITSFVIQNIILVPDMELFVLDNQYTFDRGKKGNTKWDFFMSNKKLPVDYKYKYNSIRGCVFRFRTIHQACPTTWCS